jgi:hypothetical protein
MQQKVGMGWLDRLTAGTGHGFYRLISLASSIASAYAIFWYLGGYSNDVSQKIFAGALCFVFVVIGYVTVRNIAHRLKDKQMIWSYVPLLALFLFIEVGANLAHGLFFAQTVPWLTPFVGQERVLFQRMLAFSIACLPLLNIFLAAVEVDLMRQASQPKFPALVPIPSAAGAGTTTLPQASYPTMLKPSGVSGMKSTLSNGSVPGSSVAQMAGSGNPGNNLKRFYQQQGGQPGR